jgi:hypothetical protein
MRRCLCVQTRPGFMSVTNSSWLMNDRFDAGPWICEPLWVKSPRLEEPQNSIRVRLSSGWPQAGYAIYTPISCDRCDGKRERKIITFWFKLIVYIFQPYALKLAVYRRQSAISSAVYFHTQHFHANRWAFNGQTLVEFDQGQTVRSRSNISHMNDNYILWLFSLEH